MEILFMTISGILIAAAIMVFAVYASRMTNRQLYIMLATSLGAIVAIVFLV